MIYHRERSRHQQEKKAEKGEGKCDEDDDEEEEVEEFKGNSEILALAKATLIPLLDVVSKTAENTDKVYFNTHTVGLI